MAQINAFVPGELAEEVRSAARENGRSISEEARLRLTVPAARPWSPSREEWEQLVESQARLVELLTGLGYREEASGE